MRKSSLLLLAGAVLLGLLAVGIVKLFLGQPVAPQPVTAAIVTVPVVVTAAPLAFGDKIASDKLKLVQYPVGSTPGGAYTNIAAAIGPGDRIALHALAVNEPVSATSVSGHGQRLSTSGSINPLMRAVAINVTEISGTGGFLAPGDHVDVFITHPKEDKTPPFVDLLIQNVRVIGIGQEASFEQNKPVVVKSATLEVTPSQAERITLAQEVGRLSVSLRNLADEARTPLPTAHVADLRDEPPAAIRRAVVHVVHRRTTSRILPPAVEVTVVRGMSPTSYPMGPAS